MTVWFSVAMVSKSVTGMVITLNLKLGIRAHLRNKNVLEINTFFLKKIWVITNYNTSLG